MTPEEIYDAVDVSMATDEHAPEIERLSKANNFEYEGWDIDWSKVFPSWIMALFEGRVAGCCQVLIGYPVGRVEFISADMSLDKPIRYAVVKKLALTGFAMLAAQGVQGVAATVPFELPGSHDLVESLGGVDINEGWLMIARTS